MPKKEDMQVGMKKMIIHGVKETYNKKRDDMQEGTRKIIIVNEGKEIYIPELQGWTFPSLIDGDNPTGWIYKVDQFFDVGNLLLITFPNPIWIMEIKMSYELDTEVQNCIIEKLGNKNLLILNTASEVGYSYIKAVLWWQLIWSRVSCFCR